MHRKGKSGAICGGSGPTTIDDLKVTCARCAEKVGGPRGEAAGKFIDEVAKMLEVDRSAKDSVFVEAAVGRFGVEGVDPFTPDFPALWISPEGSPGLWVGLRGSKDLEVPGYEALALIEGETMAPVVPVRYNPVRINERRRVVIYGKEPVDDVADIMDRLFAEGWESVDLAEQPYDEWETARTNLRELMTWAKPEFDKRKLITAVGVDLAVRAEKVVAGDEAMREWIKEMEESNET